MLFPATAVEDACAILHRMRESWLPSAFAPTTFSAGVSAVVESDSEPGQAGPVAMRAADALMYVAKAAGRDRVECQLTAPPGGTRV